MTVQESAWTNAHFCTVFFVPHTIIFRNFAPCLTQFLFVMKHFYLFIVMVFLCQIASADSTANSDRKELCTTTRNHSTVQSPAMRIPARSDLLLDIQETGITIRFNGDFGPGFYQILDNESGISVSGSVVAESGSTEYVPFQVSATISFDFNIEFEDGSWSHLAWGNEEE